MDQVTVSRELLRQAIEALTHGCQPGCESGMTDSGGIYPWGEPVLIPCPSCTTLTALRTALEQPAVEPSAVFYRCNHCGHGYEDQPPSSCDCATGYGFERVEYFTAPQAQEKS